MITLENINIKFGNKDILTNSQISIPLGAITCITGPSGSGKTTLLRYITLNKFDPSMHYTIDDQNITTSDSLRDVRNHYFSYVFQNFELIPNYTINQSLKIGAYSGGAKIDNYRAKELLKLVNLEYKNLNSKVNQLSGGEKQRLQIAVALAKDTPYIILDEPTSSLDQTNCHMISKILNQLKNNGKGIIVVSHDIEIFDYDLKYEIIDQKIECSKDNKIIESTLENNIKITYLWKISSIFKYSDILIQMLIGISLAASLFLFTFQNNLTNDLKEAFNKKYNLDTLILANSGDDPIGEIGSYQDQFENEVVTQWKNIDNVESIETFSYLGGSYFVINENGMYNATITKDDINFYYGSETIDSSSLYNDSNNPYYLNSIDSVCVYPIDEKQEDFSYYNNNIDEGIIITQRMFDQLHLSSIDDVRVQLKVSIPIFMVHNESATTIFDEKSNSFKEDISWHNYATVGYMEKIELPIKAVIKKDIYQPYVASQMNFYMTYTQINMIIDQEIEKRKELIQYYEDTNLLHEQYGTGDFYKIGNEPSYLCIKLKDYTQLIDTINELNKIYPNFHINSMGIKLIEQINKYDHSIKQRKIISYIIFFVVMILSSILTIMNYKMNLKYLTYLHVNGINIMKYQIYKLINESFLSFISVIISILTLKLSSFSYNLDYKSLFYLFIFYGIMFMINLFVSNHFNKKVDISLLSTKGTSL